ncbi:MAG: PorT family protein [Bacteroidales bacterium]|nr:PorT family protein [Bacteroidales bacterium]
MKKITICILALFFAFGLSAQTHFGIKGGLNFSSHKDIKFKEGGNSSVSWNSTGWHAGILVQAKLPLGFAFQPELLYSVRKFDSKISTANYKFDFSYVELPLNLQWGIDLLIFRPYVFAGPYVSYLASMGGKAKEWDGVKNLGYGCGAGFGIDLWILQITGKWNWAFGTLGDIGKSDIVFGSSNLNGFQLSVGLLF